PERVALLPDGALEVDYLEDDGIAERLMALVRLLARHPVRCAVDFVRRRAGEPPLSELAAGVERLERDGSARILTLGPPRRHSPVARMARLAGRSPDEMPAPPRLPPVRRLRPRR
ncbi:MAG TPA: hypothetical protein VKQ71_15340, partial [Acidimicrobiales bacterium]|nr:hypothetical protein [Acidimicrobiales bacterium]